jgi:predicted aspartyl protease
MSVVVATGGCASRDLGQANSYRGDSGAVNWEIVGIRTNISEDQRQIRWNYTLILRETAGYGIQFERMETSAQGGEHADALIGGTQVQPFRLRLAARAEYRFNADYSLTFTPAVTGGFGSLPGGRGGVTVLYRLFGRDETGRSVTVAMRVALYPGAGTPGRVAGTTGLSASPTVPPATPEASPAETPKEAPARNPAWEVANECAARSTTLKVLDISESGSVHFEAQPGEEDEFLACYKANLHERLTGHLVDASGGPLRTSVPIEFLGTSFVVTAIINGTHRARLLVDTGATMTIVRPRVVERIEGAVKIEGLQPSITVASGDSITVRLARLRSLAVGAFEVEGLHVGVYDVLPKEVDIDGLLGTDFLHRFAVSVDSGAQQLSLERKP